MVTGIKFIKAISVNTTDIGIPGQFVSQKHCFLGSPECKLIFSFLILKRVGFSCMGGSL